jgi:amidophosphoribosyltransferase
MQGVVGVYSRVDAVKKALYTLYGVQHRGQESSGLSAAGDHSLRTWKERGLVSKVFVDRFPSFIHPDDYVVIGCASGENADNEIAPIGLETDRYQVSLTFDGYVPDRGSGTNEETFARVLQGKLEEGLGIEDALSGTMVDMPMAYYCLVMAVRDKEAGESFLIAARDPVGVRPLYVAFNGEDVIVASESAPIDVMESMGMSFVERRDFAPGSILKVDGSGVEERKVLEPRRGHCIFEWVYFGRPDSVIEGQTVHSVRKRLGHALVETHGLEDEYEGEEVVVIPTPDSGRSVCTGVAESLGVSSDEGVIKNAYLGRTYIIDDPEFRKTASDLKHNIIKETVRGKRVVITDDSIVRGTVSESVAQNLLKAGAREVDFLVSYGPIFYPCLSDPEDKPLAARAFEGQDLVKVGELVAMGLPSIQNVRYNSPENVVGATGLPRENLCIRCMTGESPFRRG